MLDHIDSSEEAPADGHLRSLQSMHASAGKLLREGKLDGSHGTSSRNPSVSRSLQKAASASIVVHLEDSSPDTMPKKGKRASIASK